LPELQPQVFPLNKAGLLGGIGPPVQKQHDVLELGFVPSGPNDRGWGRHVIFFQILEEVFIQLYPEHDGRGIDRQ
jgi:hypothetical protein